MNPLKLTKILLLSLLTIFILPVQNIFAQTMEETTYTNPMCSQVPGCYSTYHKYPIGAPKSFTKQQNDDTLKYFCWKMTNNEQAVVVASELSTAESAVTFLNWSNYWKRPDFGMTTAREKFYTSITCAVPKPQILGCTNPEATNYDSQATEDDGSCIVPPPPVLGCTDPMAINYNSNANQDDGSCKPKIEGCTDITALNYNPNANIHVESMCQYPPTHIPQDITGAFEKSQVSIGATTWTIKFILNVPNATLDPSIIQTWNKFTAVDSTTNDKTLTITLRQFDDQRLDVECTNYEITIPRHALTTTNGDTNPNPISGNFEVVGCQNSNTDPQDPNTQNQDEENKPKHENTIKESNFYLSLYDTDEKGKVYINLTNLIYIIGFLSFFTILFFILFGFIKNSFLGKSKR